MGLFKKKTDPISDRARALSEEIAALEEQIRRLDTEVQSSPAAPRLRSTTMPQGAAGPAHAATAAPPAPPAPPLPSEPIFEEVDHDRLQSKDETATTPGH